MPVPSPNINMGRSGCAAGAGGGAQDAREKSEKHEESGVIEGYLGVIVQSSDKRES